MAQQRKTLKALREERGLNQVQLAAQLGVSLSMISGIETRRNQPSVNFAVRIAAFFGVPVESIDWPTDADVSAKRASGKKAAA